MYDIVTKFRKKYEGLNYQQMVVFAEQNVKHSLTLSKGEFKEEVCSDSGVCISFDRFFSSSSIDSCDEEVLLDNQEECRSLMKKLEKYAWNMEPSMENLIISLNTKRQKVYIYNSITQTLREDNRWRTRLTAEVILAKYGKKALGFAGPGLSVPPSEYLQNISGKTIMNEALQRARSPFFVKPISGEECLPVVLAEGYGAILIHEACGHCLEADTKTPLDDYLGKKLGIKELNIIDDPTDILSWGNFKIDDEGFPAAKITLIEEGVPLNKLHTLSSCNNQIHLLGHARRENYRFRTLPRMSTTKILEGTVENNEIIAQTPKGIFVSYALNGIVDFNTGNFKFPVTEARWILNGKLTEPVSNFYVSGNCVDAIRNIDLIGGNIQSKSVICGKEAQNVECSIAQPMIRISGLKIVPNSNHNPKF